METMCYDYIDLFMVQLLLLNEKWAMSSSNKFFFFYTSPIDFSIFSFFSKLSIVQIFL